MKNKKLAALVLALVLSIPVFTACTKQSDNKEAASSASEVSAVHSETDKDCCHKEESCCENSEKSDCCKDKEKSDNSTEEKSCCHKESNGSSTPDCCKKEESSEIPDCCGG